MPARIPRHPAATTLKKDDLFIAKVDATANRELGDRFDVRGFPTLKFFRGGKPTEYGGGRTADEIVNWVTKKSGPAFKVLEGADGVKAFAADAEVAVVGFFSDDSTDAAAAFKAVAGAVDSVPFGIVADADAASANGVSDGAIVAFRSFEGEEDAVFEGDVTVDALTTFVNSAALPLVVPFSSANANKIFSGPIMNHFLLFVDVADKSSADLMAAYRQAAVDRKGTVLFITVGPAEDRVMGYFDISAEDTPTAVLVSMPEGAAMKKFAYPKVDGKHDFSTEALVQFVDDFSAGKLKPFLKSEPIPADGEDYDGNVKVIVGKSFEAVALDESKDVLVEFYAPWCGHCKALAPEYEKAAEHFEDVDSVVIAKVDATANEVDHPGVNVQGFPTLYFFPAGSNTPVTFDGDRTADGIIEFINKNAASDISKDSEDL
ncbi:pdi-2 [Symbiodinium sp. KB8]|nr:pdi-2 [Symbiodinium sp. KB8]